MGNSITTFIAEGGGDFNISFDIYTAGVKIKTLRNNESLSISYEPGMLIGFNAVAKLFDVSDRVYLSAIKTTVYGGSTYNQYKIDNKSYVIVYEREGIISYSTGISFS